MSMRQLPIEEMEGQQCLYVPIGKKGEKGQFLCDKASWDNFLDRGHSPSTTFTLKGRHVYFSDGKRSQCLARLFKRARPDEEIVYVKGDSLDLRLSRLGTKPRRGKATTVAAVKESKPREHWKIDPNLIGGDALDLISPDRSVAVEGFFDPAELISQGRVEHRNPSWHDKADRYIAELNRLYAMRDRESGKIVPTWGKRYKTWSAK